MSDPLTENILQTVRSPIQDFVAPSVRELSVRMESLDKRMDSLEKRGEEQYRTIRDTQDAQFKSANDKMDTQFKSVNDKMDAQFRAIMSAIGEAKAKGDLEVFKMVSALTERVVALETARR